MTFIILAAILTVGIITIYFIDSWKQVQLARARVKPMTLLDILGTKNGGEEDEL